MLMWYHSDIVHKKRSSQVLGALTSKQSQTVIVVFHTFVVTVLYSTAAYILATSHHSGNFSHFFGLILQSLLKPICFAHLIGNCAFILIASQFKRRLRQAVT